MLDQSSEQSAVAQETMLATRIPASDHLPNDLEQAIQAAQAGLLAQQRADGHWCFELEADCTIPAEYILMMHFMDELDEDLQRRLANYLRKRQTADGGWPLYTDGDFNISCSVKAYYALKLAGDSPQAEHMRTAREAILRHGGAAKTNVFTRIALAMFQQVPWRAVPFIPAELMLLPRWFPFNIYKVSYWSRTVMVPLAVLYSLKATAKNPSNVGVRELFVRDPWQERDYFPVSSKLNAVFLRMERILRLFEPLVPDFVRNYSIDKALDWMIPRLNGEDGLGGIFPAMVNAYEVLALLGYPEDHELRLTAKRALQKLLVTKGEESYCQPCMSPIWDTALSVLALNEAQAQPQPTAPVIRALDWIAERQVRDFPQGDWRVRGGQICGGGWAFEYENPYYPDIDDTAMVAWAMLSVDEERYREHLDLAAEWVASMQSKNGGFAAFDKDNTHFYLNDIPFADHGALLDPPTSDVSARCLVLLGHPNYANDAQYARAKQQCLAFLMAEQETSGAWYGRWGTNYIYGVWSVLTGIAEAGQPLDQFAVKRAVKWLKQVQRADGGWGETNDSYLNSELAGQNKYSTALHTALALLSLMAVGEVSSSAVRRGVEFLLQHQQQDGLWQDRGFTAPGFPKVFYLKYHGYDKFFPLWALARYRNLMAE